MCYQDGRLESGDIIQQINDVMLEKKSRDDVFNMLKNAVGTVRMTVKREVIEVSSMSFF